MKYCVDCRHSRLRMGLYMCVHPDLTDISRVTGQRIPMYADEMRKGARTDGCGNLGLKFERAPVAPKRWWQFWR